MYFNDLEQTFKVTKALWNTMTNFEKLKKVKRPAPTRTRCGRVQSTLHRDRRLQGRTGRQTCWQSASLGETGPRSWDSWSPCRQRWSAESSAGSSTAPDAAMRPPTGRPVVYSRPPRPSSYPAHRRHGSSSLLTPTTRRKSQFSYHETSSLLLWDRSGRNDRNF